MSKQELWKDPHVRKCTIEKLDIEISTTENVRRWICLLKNSKKEQKSMKETMFEIILN